MFGISFGELLIIGVVGLVVLGPERLPAVARTLGRLMRQVQGYADSFKAELNRELHNAEILQLEKELKEEGRRLHADIATDSAPILKETAAQAEAAQQDILQNWHSGATLDHTSAIPNPEPARHDVLDPTLATAPNETAAARDPASPREETPKKQQDHPDAHA